MARPVLRKVASSDYEGLGDLTALAEPGIVSILIDEYKDEGRQRGGYDS
jgi:hypothetical protein